MRFDCLLDERVGIAWRYASLLRLFASVHLHQQIGALARALRFTGQLQRQLLAVQAVDRVEEAQRFARLVRLQRPDQPQLEALARFAPRPPARRRLLHAVFAIDPLPAGPYRLDLRIALLLGYRHQPHRTGRATSGELRRCNACLDGREAGRMLKRGHVRNALILAAERLHREACAPATLPCLFFFTDPQRTSDPVAIARRLPRGTAIVYRHFGALDRTAVAQALAKIARRRRLILLIGDDPALAHQVRAHGVHLPERIAHRAAALKRANPNWLVTAAAHSGRAIRKAAAADAIVLSPVFPTRSAHSGPALRPLRAMRLTELAHPPILALGGITSLTARRLAGRGFAGVAAIDALLSN